MTRLSEGEQYYFRVLPENKYGIGEPAETNEAATTSEVPDAPKSLDVVEITKQDASLVWTKPESDGGSSITTYLVEMQRVGMETWITKSTTSALKYDDMLF